MKLELLILAKEVCYERIDKAIAKYAASGGCKIAVVANDDDVAHGRKTVKQAIADMNACIGLIPKFRYRRVEGYICTDLEGNECWETSACAIIKWTKKDDFNYRLPDCGMLWRPAMDLEPDDKVLMVGTTSVHQQAANNAEIDFLWAQDWIKEAS